MYTSLYSRLLKSLNEKYGSYYRLIIRKHAGAQLRNDTVICRFAPTKYIAKKKRREGRENRKRTAIVNYYPALPKLPPLVLSGFLT